MSEAPVTIALVIIGMMATLIIASAGSGGAKTLKQCDKSYSQCTDVCDHNYRERGEGTPWAKCISKCDARLLNCGTLGNSKTVMVQPLPNGKRPLPPKTVTGIQQPSGGGSHPMERTELGQMIVRGMKKFAEGWS